MPDTVADQVWTTLGRWPLGYFTATYAGRRYGVTRSVHAHGQSMKLWAEELGGPDRISLNIYAPPHGEAALKPCEMPVDKVTAFVLGAMPEQGSGAGQLRQRLAVEPPEQQPQAEAELPEELRDRRDGLYSLSRRDEPEHDRGPRQDDQRTTDEAKDRQGARHKP